MRPRPYIVFFDGVCNLCNRAVQRIIRGDHKNRCAFAALQSPFTKTFFAAHQYTPSTDSIIVWTGSHFLEQSDAALFLAMRLRFPYPLLRILYILPKKLRDYLYAFVAKRRYTWFGKRDSCMLPQPGQADLFMDGVNNRNGSLQ